MTSNHKPITSSSAFPKQPQLLPTLAGGGGGAHLPCQISWKIILYSCRNSKEILTQLSLYLCAHVKYGSAVIHKYSSPFWHLACLTDLDFSSGMNLSCSCIGIWWERGRKPPTAGRCYGRLPTLGFHLTFTVIFSDDEGKEIMVDGT